MAFRGVQAELKPSGKGASFSDGFPLLFIGLLLAKPKQKPGTREVPQYIPSKTASRSTEKDGESRWKPGKEGCVQAGTIYLSRHSVNEVGNDEVFKYFNSLRYVCLILVLK